MRGSQLAAAELRVLLGEVQTTRGLLRDLAHEVTERDPGPTADPGRAVLALLAVDLHSYYTAVESLLERVLAAFDGAVPEGESSHALVLRAAFRSIPGVRPAVFRPELRDCLEELRRFRHFFRHAYALELRFDKLRRVLDPWGEAWSHVDEDLGELEQFLDGLIAEIERS